MSLLPWRRRPRPSDEGAPAHDPREVVRAYHEATKHAPMRFARGPLELDWANQPDPFRRWAGAAEVPLERSPPAQDGAEALRYTQVFQPDAVAPRALDASTLARLLYDAFALSAWKEFQGTRWALRVNPSSGNLHPTEVHVACGPVPGIARAPFVAHYAPREHALELRAELPVELWDELTRELPAGSLLVGLASIHWREAWKYGERAWRYCQHDLGHALATLRLSAAGLGWRARLVDAWSTEDIERLLGLRAPQGPEAEHAEALVVVSPAPTKVDAPSPPGDSAAAALDALAWAGAPSALSPEHVEWDVLEVVAAAARKPRTEARAPAPLASAAHPPEPPAGPPWREVVHHRRSAVAMDAATSMELDDLVGLLRRTLPGSPPFDALPWPPALDLMLFVHRVDGLERGLYALVRAAEREPLLRAALDPRFDWERPPGVVDLPLRRLRGGDARGLAAGLSCTQAIAGDGCFSLGMLADLERVEREGAWTYPRLFWESGAIGQVLYLEAEALGLRGTGIGCFFDDEVHRALGLRGRRFQSLYHFALGAPVEDARLTTLPPYSAEPPRVR